MNVTESRFKNRQLHMEDYLQMVSAEQKEYAEVFDYSKIAEKSSIITDYWTDNLLDLILRKDNLNKAYKRVKSNKGAGGTDGMQVDELLPYLKENQDTVIQQIRSSYTFYKYKGKCRFRVHPKSVQKMRNKLRELTDRNNGMSNQLREERYQQFVRGWVNYFKLADMKGLLQRTDEWARRRIRAVYWKQWKKIKTKYRMLRALKLEHSKALELAMSRKKYWRMSKVLSTVLTDKLIAKLGYTSMLDYYLVVCEN